MKAMAYEDMPLTAPSIKSVKQELKRAKEKDINRMSSYSVVWFLVKRHRIGIITNALIIETGFIVFSWLF